MTIRIENPSSGGGGGGGVWGSITGTITAQTDLIGASGYMDQHLRTTDSPTFNQLTASWLKSPASTDLILSPGVSNFIRAGNNINPDSDNVQALGYDNGAGFTRYWSNVYTMGLKLGTSATAGYVLTTDVNGNGTWQAAGGGSMVYPGAGIPLSTGSAWGTSITNNSSNWNTAYGWGNHASAGYFVGTNSTIRGLFSAGTGISYNNATGVITSSITQYTDAMAVSAVGTPWTGMGYLTSLSGAVLTDQTVGQTIGATGTRLTKLWATDITVTNAITGSVTGNAGTVSGLTITAGASISNANTGDQTLSGLGGQPALNGTGFVKASGTTISYDNSTYLTSVTAHNLLSTTHGDTTASACARGSVIVGDVNSKWINLAFPATPTGKIIQATATDVAWSTNPLTIGASASVSGSNTGDQTLPTDATISVTNVTTNDASTTAHGWALKATAPAAGLINVLGIGNAETVYSMKPLFDATSPTTQAFGDAASVGTATVSARRDHKHAMMAAPTTISGNAGSADKWSTTRAFTTSGDVVVTSANWDGSANFTSPATIAAKAVTYAKIQDVSATSRIMGRITAGAGSMEELTAANVKTILSLAQADISGLTTGSSPTFTGATLSGLTQGSVLFAGASGVISQDNANAFYDATNHRMGFGTTTPLAPLHATDTSANSFRGIISEQVSSDINASQINIFKARGTPASKTSPLSGDINGGFFFRGWNSASYATGGYIRMVFTENWDSTHNGSKLVIAQTLTGGTTQQETLTLDNGNIVLGNQAALATNATDGFAYIPTCAGKPTGAPTAYTGKAAVVMDTTNNCLGIYNGAWYFPGKFKTGYISRDMTAASGDVSYTGIGFKPRSIIVMSGTYGGKTACWGMDNAVTPASLYVGNINSGSVYTDAASISIIIYDTNLAYNQTAKVKTFDSDGFTLTWVKTGTPGAGTGYTVYMAIG